MTKTILKRIEDASKFSMRSSIAIMLAVILTLGIVSIGLVPGSIYGAPVNIDPSTITNNADNYSFVNFYASWFSMPYNASQQIKSGSAFINDPVELQFKTEFTTVGTFEDFTLSIEAKSGGNGDLGDAYTKFDFGSTQTSIAPFSGLNGKSILYRQSINPGTQGNGLIKVSYNIAELGHLFYQGRTVVLRLKGTHVISEDLSCEVELVRALTLDLKSNPDLTIRKDFQDHAKGDPRSTTYTDDTKAYVRYQVVVASNTNYMPCAESAVFTDTIQPLKAVPGGQLIYPLNAYMSSAVGFGSSVKFVNQSYNPSTYQWRIELQSTVQDKPFWFADSKAYTGGAYNRGFYITVEYPVEALETIAGQRTQLTASNTIGLTVKFDNENYGKPAGTISKSSSTSKSIDLLVNGDIGSQKWEPHYFKKDETAKTSLITDIAPLVKEQNLPVTFWHEIQYGTDNMEYAKIVHQDFDTFEKNPTSTRNMPMSLTYISDATGKSATLEVRRVKTDKSGNPLEKPIVQLESVRLFGMGPVTRYGAGGKVTFYEKGNAVPFAQFSSPGTVTLPAGQEVTEFYAVADEAYGSGRVTFYTNWIINYDMLSKVLSPTEILTIYELRNYQQGYWGEVTPTSDNWNVTVLQLGLMPLALSKSEFLSPEMENSYIFGEEDEGLQWVDNSISIIMDATLRYPLINENPVFFIELSNDFDYKYESITLNSSGPLRVIPSSFDLILKDGKVFLTFKCDGTYLNNNAGVSGNVEFKMNFTARLKNSVNIGDREPFYVWMGTDNDIYWTPVADKYSLDNGPDRSNYMARQTVPYKIETASNMILTNSVYNSEGELIDAIDKAYLPIGSEAVFNLKVFDGINSDKFNNFELLTRLPFIGNDADIAGIGVPIDMGSQFDAPFNRLIAAYKLDSAGVKTSIDIGTVKIFYSPDADATFDSPSFTTDPTDAKTVKFVFPAGMTMSYREQLIVEYGVNIPDEISMVDKTSWEVFNTRHKVVDRGDEWVIDPQPDKVGVTLGDAPRDGVVTVTKVTDDGAPFVEGIEFTIVDLLTNGEAFSVSGMTDAQGKIEFGEIPRGSFKITETKSSSHYRIPAAQFFAVTNKNKNIEMTFTNDVKKGSLEITKLFRDDEGEISEKLFNAQFNLHGISITGQAVSLFASGKGTIRFDDVPLGEYILDEVYPDGASAANAKFGYELITGIEVVIDEEDQEFTKTVENDPAFGTLRIVKTSEDDEQLEDRIFRITGTSAAGDEIDEVVLTGAGGKCDIELPVGTYWIEEIATPDEYTKPDDQKVVITDGKVTDIVTANVFNAWKRGSLSIRKLMDAGSKGISLGGWVFKIYGTSRYSTPIEIYGVSDRNGYVTDISGNRIISGILESGSAGYTIEEIGRIDIDELEISEADSLMGIFDKAEFNTALESVFGEGYSIDSLEMPLGVHLISVRANSAGVTMEDNKVEGITVYDKSRTTFEGTNIYDGKGKLRIVKIADGGDINKALGIKFIITGKDFAGRNVKENITTKTGTYNGQPAAIAESGYIYAGTYAIEEDRASVPSDYLVSTELEEVTIYPDGDPKEIVYEVTNYQKKGGLKIQKVTDPTGGPVEGISFRITSIGVEGGDEKFESGAVFKTNAQGVITIPDMIAGKYKVEEILDGAQGDYEPMDGITTQIVQVLNGKTADIVFVNVCDPPPPPEEPDKNMLILHKKVVNANGDPATPDDYKRMRLNINTNYVFDIRLINKQTGESFNGLLYRDDKLVFYGLPYGTYTIAEECRTPFKFVKIEEISSEYAVFTDNKDGTYEFTFTRPEIDDTFTTLELEITNMIKTGGFVHTDDAQNMLRVESINAVRKLSTINIHLVTWEDDYYTGYGTSEFELWLEGSKIGYIDAGGTLYFTDNSGADGYTQAIEITDGGASVRKLAAGTYTLKQISLPAGAVGGLDDDMEIEIEGGTVTNIYIGVDDPSNLPSGVFLRTYYINGDTPEYIDSIYEIYALSGDLTSNDPLRFTKKANGSYIINSLGNATVRAQGEEYTRILLPPGEYLFKSVFVGESCLADDFTITLSGGEVTKDVAAFYIKDVFLLSTGSHALTSSDDLIDLNPTYDTYGQVVIPNVEIFIDDISIGAAVDKSGDLWLWGGNTYGQLGDGTTTARTAPFNVSANTDLGSGIKSVECNGYNTFVIKDDGSLWGWGRFCGDGTQGPTLDPVQIMASGADKIYTHASSNRYFINYVIKTDGSLWSWGTNTAGQLGDGTTDTRLAPEQIIASGVEEVYMLKAGVAAANSTIAAKKSDGSLWTWGNNMYGQVGDGTTDHRLTPYNVSANSALDTIEEIYCCNYTFYAKKSDGSLWDWGGNGFGQIGDGTTNNRLTPYQVMASGAEEVWFDESAVVCSIYVKKSDDSLWAWGFNIYGQIGDGTMTDRLSPYNVSANTSLGNGIEEVYLYIGTVNVKKSDGSLWIWGENTYGQIGDGTTTKRLSPFRIFSSGMDEMIPDFTQHPHIKKSDGSLWIWGRNDRGQLGDGTTTNRTTPYQPTFNFEKFAFFSYSVVGIKSDRSVWRWGDNVLVPTQIPDDVFVTRIAEPS